MGRVDDVRKHNQFSGHEYSDRALSLLRPLQDISETLAMIYDLMAEDRKEDSMCEKFAAKIMGTSDADMDLDSLLEKMEKDRPVNEEEYKKSLDKFIHTFSKSDYVQPMSSDMAI